MLVSSVGAFIWALASNHIDAILAFGGILAKILFDKTNQYDVEAAKTQVFNMAIDATRLVAKEALDNKEKRNKAIEMVIEAMPENIKKKVPVQMVEFLVEQAYTHIIKPSLN